MPKITEEVSPCKKCANAGIDKRLCSDFCHRLKAWQLGRDYTKEEAFIVAEGKDLVEDIENGESNTEITSPVTLDHIDMELEEPDDKSEGAEDEKKCAICGKPESDENQFLRGVCRNPCYMKWYSGKIKHPTLGKFKRAPREEVEYPAGDMNKPEAKEHIIPETDEDICQQTATIDMDRYPLIKVAVYRMAVRLSLPISHIIITLLAEALEARRKGVDDS